MPKAGHQMHSLLCFSAKDWARTLDTDSGYNPGKLFNVMETWYLAAILLQRWDDLASVSHEIGNVIMPGDPAYGMLEPEVPIPLSAVCGPRRTRKATNERAEQPAAGPTATKRRVKAPPPYLPQPQSSGTQPPAPGGTGSYLEAAQGTPSKTAGPKTVPKKPPPQLPTTTTEEVKEEVAIKSMPKSKSQAARQPAPAEEGAREREETQQPCGQPMPPQEQQQGRAAAQ
eukprot:6481435-Amphidinium_carterae.1